MEIKSLESPACPAVLSLLYIPVDKQNKNSTCTISAVHYLPFHQVSLAWWTRQHWKMTTEEAENTFKGCNNISIKSKNKNTSEFVHPEHTIL